MAAARTAQIQGEPEQVKRRVLLIWTGTSRLNGHGRVWRKSSELARILLREERGRCAHGARFVEGDGATVRLTEGARAAESFTAHGGGEVCSQGPSGRGAAVADPGGPRVRDCFRSARDVRLTGRYVGCG